MRNLKLINQHLNNMHESLAGLHNAIEDIEGKVSRSAAKDAYNKLIELFEFLDGALS